MRHYKLRWHGPYDAPSRPERILTMQAENKDQAVKLLADLFPIANVKCTLAKQPRRKKNVGSMGALVANGCVGRRRGNRRVGVSGYRKVAKVAQ